MEAQKDFDDKQLAALATFSKVIQHERDRKAFAKKPKETLHDAGADFDDLPETFRNTVADLSHRELALLADVSGALVEGEFAIKTRGGGTVCVL